MVAHESCSLIQMINAGERLVVNNCNFGYLSHRIVFYLLNLHIKSRHTYFVRVGPIVAKRVAWC